MLGASKGLDRIVRLNAIGAYGIKGLSMLVGLAAVPAYMRYFESGAVLGTWYTIQTLLQWVLMFDLGVGNGLRNKLVSALVSDSGREVSGYVSSSYRLMAFVCLGLVAVVAFLGVFVPWNTVLNIDVGLVNAEALSICMTVVGIGVVLQLFLQLINGILYALQLSFVVNALSLASNSLILAFILVMPGGGDEMNLIMLGFVNVVCMVMPPAAATAVVFGRRLLGFSIDWRSFEWSFAKSTLSAGLVILFLQVVWMIVASTHSLLISLFRDPSEVVEYQIYYKIYYTLGSLAAISLVPIWSAVTLAQAQGRYGWVIWTYRKCLLLSVVVGLVCLVVAPFIQIGFDLWLGDRSVQANSLYILVMSAFAVTFVLQNVNASIGNGLSYFRVQVALMGLAAVLMVPLSAVFCAALGSWIGVVIAMVVAITPFQIVEPLVCIRHLRRLEAKGAGTTSVERN